MGILRRAVQGVRNIVGRVTGGQVGTRQVAQRTIGGGTGRGLGRTAEPGAAARLNGNPVFP
jgi:hypothetical protein